MKKNNKNNFFSKVLPKVKEFFRKSIVTLKKNPSLIPLAMLLVSFLVFSLNLSDISNTTARIQGQGMGLSEFVSMLLSILSMICLLNAFPKRKKPNWIMVIIAIAFCGIIIGADVIYLNCIASSSIVVTQKTKFILAAKNVMTTHIVLTAITAVTIVLEPLFAKLLKKINTTVELEETNVASIELADEE